MDFMKFVADKALILIPALYMLGRILKSVKFVKDNNIPIILLIFGIGLSVWMLGFNPDGVIQGILVTGAAVYTHQLVKQSRKHRRTTYDKPEVVKKEIIKTKIDENETDESIDESQN